MIYCTDKNSFTAKFRLKYGMKKCCFNRLKPNYIQKTCFVKPLHSKCHSQAYCYNSLDLNNHIWANLNFCSIKVYFFLIWTWSIKLLGRIFLYWVTFVIQVSLKWLIILCLNKCFVSIKTFVLNLKAWKYKKFVKVVQSFSQFRLKSNFNLLYHFKLCLFFHVI